MYVSSCATSELRLIAMVHCCPVTPSGAKIQDVKPFTHPPLPQPTKICPTTLTLNTSFTYYFNFCNSEIISQSTFTYKAIEKLLIARFTEFYSIDK